MDSIPSPLLTFETSVLERKILLGCTNHGIILPSCTNGKPRNFGLSLLDVGVEPAAGRQLEGRHLQQRVKVSEASLNHLHTSVQDLQG